MAYISKKALSINTAQQFIDDIVAGDVNLYISIGKVTAWANDSNPTQPVDDIQQTNDLWRNLIGGKKLTGFDMSLVVPRIDWTSNTVYTPYTDTSNIYGKNFYVLTSDYNVYKCIDNNSNTASTIMPTYVEPDRTILQSDGYTWKYMTTLRQSDVVRFLTSSWFPVRTLTLNDGSMQWQVQQDAIDGSLSFVKLTSVGANTYNANVTVTITGDGTSANISGTVNLTSQTVSSLAVVNPGAGFHYANATITATSGGSGATALPIISPPGGHGSNPTYELGASNIMIAGRFNEDESGFLSTQNDFRQISLIANPLAYANTALYSNSTFDQTTELFLSSGGGDYTLDEYVFQGTALANSTFSGIVVDWNSTNNTLKICNTTGTPSSAGLLGLSSGTFRFIISTLSADLTPYSGQVHYIDNVVPIQRASDQIENIQIVLEF